MSEPLSDQFMVIFCNGLNNSFADAQKSAKALHLAIGRPVFCCYNDSLGKTLLSTVARWSIVEQRKEICARRLAEQVQAYLQQSPNMQVLLILHSQGRDIGVLALQKLSIEEKMRMTVVTLGSSPIAADGAKKVINLRLRKDPIPLVMEARDKIKKIVHLDFSREKSEKMVVDGKGHFLSTYLEKQQVQETLFQINRKIFKMQSSC
jgi:esterase/lipase superfamily enzyme